MTGCAISVHSLWTKYAVANAPWYQPYLYWCTTRSFPFKIIPNLYQYMSEPQALDRNFVKNLYIIKFQAVLYLSVKFQVDRLGNKEVTIHPTAYHYNEKVRHYAIFILCLYFGVVCSYSLHALRVRCFHVTKRWYLFALIYNQISSCQWKICKIYDKILNHVEKQSTMTELVKNITNPGMHKAVCRKIHKLWGRWLVNDSACSKAMWFKKRWYQPIGLQLWGESYVSKAHDWNFHGKCPISSLPSTSIKSKWRSDAPSYLYDDAEQ